MNLKYVSTLVGVISAFIAVSFGAYQLGQSGSAGSNKAIEVSIKNVISGLPQEKKAITEEVIDPLLKLIMAASEKNSKNDKEIDELTNEVVSKFSNISLVSYKADKSPFVPPKNVTQFLCEDKFVFALTSSLPGGRTKFKLNGVGKGVYPGDVRTYKAEGAELHIIYLEYRKDLNGPLLKYECEIF